MELLPIFLIALGLAGDCFAVALGCSLCIRTFSFFQVFRVSLTFGIYHTLMPVLGWLAGQTIIGLITDYDHWVAFVLLALVGGRMIWGAFHSGDGATKNIDITRGFMLLTLSVATSIDALAVGLSFAFMRVNILVASATIGSVALVVTAVGLLLGRKANGLLGRRAEAIGGMVLIGIGIKILLDHLL